MNALYACLIGLIVAISCLEMHNTFKSTLHYTTGQCSVVQILLVANEVTHRLCQLRNCVPKVADYSARGRTKRHLRQLASYRMNIRTQITVNSAAADHQSIVPSCCQVPLSWLGPHHLQCHQAHLPPRLNSPATVLSLIFRQNKTQIQLGTQEYMGCDGKHNETLGNYDD